MLESPQNLAPSSWLSIIIPTYNEARTIGRCLANVRLVAPSAEVIVADGGSRDKTPHLARAAGAEVVAAGRGRGIQCNAGAACASGDVLLFLHVDTILPADTVGVLKAYFQNEQAQIGTFRVVFDDPHPVLALYARFSRFDSVMTRFGDQAITLRRTFFDELGGFPDWPLFEDVGLLQEARLRTRVHSFPAAVITSARRYKQNGVILQQLRNLWYMLQYLTGVSPHVLAIHYERSRR